MRSYLTLFTIFSLMVNNYALPFYDVFISAEEDAPQNKDKFEIVKRDINAQSTDAKLKQIPLQSLIDELEQSLFETAFSVGGLVHDKDAVLPQITSEEEGHEALKRFAETLTAHEKDKVPVPQYSEPLPKDIILQTTEKVPATDRQPAHIIIDRISVQAHHGGVPLIPQFEVKHAQPMSATVKSTTLENKTEAEISTATSSVSVTTTTTAASSVPSSSSSSSSTTTEANHPNTSTEKSTESTSMTTITTTNSTTTTKTPKDKLEDAEKELKEKVAEIEADPVILSARI